MALDDKLVQAVELHIIGEIGKANALHLQIEHPEHYEAPVSYIGTIRFACFKNIKGMLKNPGRYANRPSYELKTEDRIFFEALLQKAEDCEWTDPNQVQELFSYVKNYYP